MNFNQLNYWPGLLVLFSLFVFIVFIFEKRFFKFVRTYWFYKRSLFSYISTFLFLLGMGGLVLSLLDIRGPEQKIKTPVPTDRTIILIDTSASMLAEDVKPSRLQKAILIAKHFARKAAGHQISVIAFAEVQTKIVPFTNDIDLIDARLESLKNLRNHYGSSALSVAIQESLQYFKETEGDSRGNILVFTDGEETAQKIDLKVPPQVHVALVGVGTEQGGRIPLDDGRGFRFGYKKDNGVDIITKLNEKFFDRVVADIPSAKHWIANSYSLPSEEILEFFQAEKQIGKDEQDMTIKPVLMEWIVLPSVLLLILSYLFKSIRIFSLGLLLVISPIQAQESGEEIQLTPEVVSRMEEMQKGNLNRLEKIKLADDLLKAGAKDEAISVYTENLPFPISENNKVPDEAYLNYGTALVEKNETQKGIKVYEDLKRSLNGTPKLKEISETIDKNIVTYFKKKEEQEKKDKEKEKDDKKENKDNKDNKDQKNEGSQDQQKKDQQKDQKPGEQDKKDKEDQKKEQDKKEQEKKDNQQGEGEDNQEKDQPQPQDGEEEKKPKPQVKMPAKLKQLMSDDRQLQMKMIENGTKELNKRKSRASKDW